MTGRLDAEQIRQPIAELACEQLESLEVFAEIESTNSYLMEQPAPMPGRFRVALAEHQTAGRGRMDRRWHSPGGTGLCLSMSYTFERRPELLTCLTLAIGVGVVESLATLGIHGVGLKWPNDLVLQDGKLGGILTEVKSGGGDEVTIVAGIGINFDFSMHPEAGRISTRLGHVSDLASCVQQLPSRSSVSAVLIEGLFDVLADFDAAGFGNTAVVWAKYDWLRGQKVSVDQANGQITGVCQGIDTDGALLLQTATRRQRITSGSVNFASQNRGTD